MFNIINYILIIEKKKGAEIMNKKFTLIELIVAILIISILAAIVIPTISEVREKAVISALEVEAETIEKAVDMYIYEQERFPTADGLKVSEETHAIRVNGRLMKAKEVLVDEHLVGKYLKKAPRNQEVKYYVVPSGDVVWEYKDLVEKVIKTPIDEDGDGFIEGYDLDSDGEIDVINFDDWIAAYVWYETYHKMFPNKKQEDFLIDYPDEDSIRAFVRENPVTMEQTDYVEKLDMSRIEMIYHTNGIQYLKNLKSFKGTTSPDKSINTSMAVMNNLIDLANNNTNLKAFYIININERDGLLMKERLQGQFRGLTEGGIGNSQTIIITYQELNR